MLLWSFEEWRVDELQTFTNLSRSTSDRSLVFSITFFFLSFGSYGHLGFTSMAEERYRDCQPYQDYRIKKMSNTWFSCWQHINKLISAHLQKPILIVFCIQMIMICKSWFLILFFLTISENVVLLFFFIFELFTPIFFLLSEYIFSF